MSLPRVLVVSNAPFDTQSNTGRTLAGLFSQWDRDALAQLYFHTGIPRSVVCDNYYRFSDVDALKAVVLRCHRGRQVSPQSVGAFREDSSAASIYRYGHGHRSPAVTLARDLVWYLSAWRSRELEEWIRKFDPEVIFFPTGDGVFPYRVVSWIAGRFSVPVVTICYDDYLMGYEDRKGPLYRLRSRLLNRWTRRITVDAPCLLTTCDMMSRAYEDKFGVPCQAMYSVASEPLPPSPGTAISYFGNVGLGRWKQLIAIGRALRSLGHPGVDVYTQEDLPEIISQLTEENGIRFHGGIPYDEVRRKTAESLAVIHTESFDADNKERVRFSVSTKIADLLASGVCPLVYGPEDVASVKYFLDHDAGCVITREEALRPMLQRLLEDAQYRRDRIANAQMLARENHSAGRNREKLAKILSDAAFGGTGRE